MGIRLLISRLASAQTRAAAGRGLAVVCGLGFLITALVLAARDDLARWFFALLVWTLFVYAPLRILLEAAGTLAPLLRRQLAAQAGHSTPFASRAGIELTVDRLLEQVILMPRIATPAQREKARDGAIAVLAALHAGVGDLPGAVVASLNALDRWVTDIGPWAQREAGQNIQARWREVRALAALAAMARVLVAVDEASGPDRTGFLNACLDYCDELALEVDVTPWREPSLGLPTTSAHTTEIQDAWKKFVETGAPAIEARTAFIDALLPRPQTPRAAPS